MIDYLSNSAVSAYFDARECQTYYEALRRAKSRRDFHPHLIEVLEKFVLFTDSPSASSEVDYVIRESLRSERQAKSLAPSSTLAAARDLFPMGIQLMELSEPLTFKSLKAGYRRASKVNHPDAGGTHEAMVAVNRAFEFAHTLLCDRQGEEEVSGVVEVTSTREIMDCAAYRYKCGEMLFLAALDGWSLDKASLWLARITSASWQISPYASHWHRRVALIEPASKLAKRLSLTGLREQAMQALSVAHAGLEEANKGHLNYGPYVWAAEDVLSGKRRTQVAISHRRQADNALRLGVIGQKQFKRIMERVEKSETFDLQCEERLRWFQGAGGFLQELPTDRVARGKVSRTQFVPDPGLYLTGIDCLTDDQQAEYLVAFGTQPALRLARKYSFVRLISLFESALLFPGVADDSAVEVEARTLAMIQDGSVKWYATRAVEAISNLLRQSAQERRERAELLYGVKKEYARVTSGSSITVSFGIPPPLGLPLTRCYFDRVLSPLDRLRDLHRAWSIP